jgi:hypothetical protein
MTRAIRVSKSQAWLLQTLMSLPEPAGVAADIRPFGGALAEKLLWALWRSEREGLEAVEVEVTEEEALRLAVILKPTMRDERGLGLKDLIIDCLQVVFGPDRVLEEVEKWMTGG